MAPAGLALQEALVQDQLSMNITEEDKYLSFSIKQHDICLLSSECKLAITSTGSSVQTHHNKPRRQRHKPWICD